MRRGNKEAEAMLTCYCPTFVCS